MYLVERSVSEVMLLTLLVIIGLLLPSLIVQLVTSSKIRKVSPLESELLFLKVKKHLIGSIKQL